MLKRPMALVLLALFWGAWLAEAAGLKSPPKGSKKKGYGMQFGAFLAVIKYTFFFAIFPILVYFVYT